jgi:hypothetical protein
MYQAGSNIAVNKTTANAPFDILGNLIVTGSAFITSSLFTNNLYLRPLGTTTENPKIYFSGSTSSSIKLEVLPDGAISFMGSSGSLFDITDSLVGSLMSVNDASGLPILEVFSDDRVIAGTYNRNTLYVTGSSVGIRKVPNSNISLDVSGSTFITGSLNVTGSTILSGSTTFRGIASFVNNTWNLSNDNFSRFYFATNGRTYFGAGAGYEWRSAADTSLAVLSDTGDLSIGKTTANAKLDVVGNTIITGSLNTTSNIKAFSTSTATNLDVEVQNSNTGTTAYSRIFASNNNGYVGGIRVHGGGFTQVNAYRQNRTTIFGSFDISYLSGQHLFWRGTTGDATDGANAELVVAMVGSQAAGTMAVYYQTTSTSPLTGAVTVAGGIGVGGTANIGGNTVITGSLTVGSAGAGIVYDTKAASDGRMEFKYNGTREALIGVDLNKFLISGDTGTDVVLYSGANTNQLVISSSGNVGIGTGTPSYKLQVNGTIFASGSGFSNPASETGYRIKFYDNGGINNDTGIGLDGSAGAEVMWFNALSGFYFNVGTGGEKVRIDSNGNVAINKTTANAKLDVSGSAAITGSLIVTGSAVITGSVAVNGLFTATAKSFLIDHPTLPNKKLQYGVAEGPEHSVFVRGIATGPIITLPDYWKNLVDENTITVQLTPIGTYQALFVTYTNSEYVHISNNNGGSNIYCYYLVQAERKDIPKLVVEI